MPRWSRRGRRGAALPLFVAVAVLTLTACGSNGSPSSPPSTSSHGPSTGPSQGPAASCVGRVLGSMSEAQRVGQLFMLGLTGDQLGPTEKRVIENRHVGSVWFVATTTGGASAVRSVAGAVQGTVSQATTAGVRFYVAANQEGGVIQALQGSGFSRIPSAVDQGMLHAAALRRDATTWGHELASAGINLDFAPVMDVVPAELEDQNQPIGVLHREFGDDPETAGGHGAAFIRGMAQAGIATTAKHFPGLGRVVGNTDFTADVVDSVTTEDDPYLDSFRHAIAAGVPFVMVALATYTRIDPGRLAVFSPTVMRTMLRQGLGFRGVIMSDDMGAAVAVADIAPADRAIRFVSAGGDMIISKKVGSAVAMIRALMARAAVDAGFRGLVDDAARRVLAAKSRSGLLPC